MTYLAKLNQTPAKEFLYPILDKVLNSWGTYNAKTYDIKNTIVVASSGRGGSTWLAEIIGTLPGYPIIWEPLHLGKNPECKNYGFNWNTYIPVGDRDPIKKNYLNFLLTGTNLSTAKVSSLAFHPIQYLRFRGFLVKFVNANLILNWMLEQFPIQAILMIRHPCAVIDSQLRHSAWHHVNKNNLTFLEQIAADYPHLTEIFHQIETREEALAFAWVLKTYVPLIQPKSRSLYITTYEDLIDNAEVEVNKIFDFLHKPVPSKAYRQLKIASNTTQNISNVATGKNPLTGWKDNLSATQIENILNIVHRSGIDFYTDDILPDRSRLNFWLV
jgi:hypothetical protein